MELEQVLYVVVLVVAFPFYTYLVCKCAGAGWTAGTVSYLGHWQKGREKNGKGKQVQCEVSS